MIMNKESMEHFTSIRKLSLTRSNNCCESCGVSCENPRLLHTHHLTYERLGREELSDVIILCAKCHSITHSLNLIPYSYYFKLLLDRYGYDDEKEIEHRFIFPWFSISQSKIKEATESGLIKITGSKILIKEIKRLQHEGLIFKSE